MTRRPKPERAGQQALVEAWNSEWRVGVQVRFWAGGGEPEIGHTRAPAELTAAGTAVIWLDERASFIELSHVKAAPVWLWSDNEEFWSACDEFDSREAAQDAAFDALDPGQTYWTGYQCRCVDQLVVGRGDAESLLETINERMYDRVGDLAEGWPDVRNEQVDELAARLQSAFRTWLRENGLEPMFTCIEGVKDHRVPEGL